MRKNILSLLAVTVTWLTLTSCGIGNESTPEAVNLTVARTSSQPLTNQDWEKAASDPLNYVGSKVDLSGRIFNVIGVQNGAFRFQMFTDPAVRGGNTHVEWAGPSEGLKEGVDVSVAGTFKEVRTATSLAGTELRVPLVVADSVEVLSPRGQGTHRSTLTPTVAISSPTPSAAVAPLDNSPAATATPTAEITATWTPIPSPPDATSTPLRTPSQEPMTPTALPAPTRDASPATATADPATPNSTPSPTQAPATPYSTPSPTQPPATPTPIPAPTRAPSPSPTLPPSVEYTVKQGDTLSQIAERYGVDTDALARYNGISSPDDIQVGQRITIPTSSVPAPTSVPPPTSVPATPAPTSTPEPRSETTYTVQAGDTLGEIAQKYGVTIEVIIRDNGISSPDELQVGQSIRIPLNID